MTRKAKAERAAQQQRAQEAAQPDLDILKADLKAGRIDYPTYERRAKRVIAAAVMAQQPRGGDMPTWQGPDWL